MGEDRKTSRDLLRKQRDEELAHGRPFPLITLAEWQAREHRARIPKNVAVLVISALIAIPLVALASLAREHPWCLVVLVLAPLVLFPLGLTCSVGFVSRRWGLCCPYCRKDLDYNINRGKHGRTGSYEDRGRCPRCQRMIFTDWSKEDGWAATDPDARRSRR